MSIAVAESIGKTSSATVADLKTRVSEAEREVRRNRALIAVAKEDLAKTQTQIIKRTEKVCPEVGGNLQELYEAQHTEAIQAVRLAVAAIEKIRATYDLTHSQFHAGSEPVKREWIAEDAKILNDHVKNFGFDIAAQAMIQNLEYANFIATGLSGII